jgi:hyperosmotically inducible protein
MARWPAGLATRSTPATRTPCFAGTAGPPSGFHSMNTTRIQQTLAGLAAALVVTLTAGCAPTAERDNMGEYVADTELTTRVKAALSNEPTLQAAEINVDTHRGVVRLSGFVSSTAAEDTAIAVARGVAGVKSVKHDTRLK